MSKKLQAWVDDKGELYLPAARLVWPNLLVAKRVKGKADSKPSFSATYLIPKAANLAVAIEHMTAAAVEKFGKDWAKKKLYLPIGKTADIEQLTDFAEAFPLYVRGKASEEYPPILFGPNARPFEGDPSDIYSGRWSIASGKFYAYDNVSKGVNFGMNRVQLREDDDVIAGGRITSSDGFEAADVGGAEGSSDNLPWNPAA